MLHHDHFAQADLNLTKPIFTGLEKLKLENFPTTRNAEFKVSDICDSDWVKDYKKEQGSTGVSQSGLRS